MKASTFRKLVNESRDHHQLFGTANQITEVNNSDSAYKYLRKCAARKFEKRLLVRVGQFFM